MKVVKTIFIILLLTIISSCNYSVSLTEEEEQESSSGSSGTSCSSTSVTVAPHYVADVNWMDYVQNNGAVGTYDSDGTNCSNADQTRAGCIHAGEIRSAALTGRTTCTDIVTTDTNSWFNWSCAVIGGVATVYSTGFQTGKGLKDLIDTTTPGWNTNSISVSINGCVTYTSADADWGWTNTVSQLVPDAANKNTDANGLDTANIYFITADANSRGFTLDADKIALVGIGVAGARITLTKSGAASGNFLELGPATDFHWVENLSWACNNIETDGIHFDDTNHSVLRDSIISNCNQDGIADDGSTTDNYSNYVYNVTINTMGTQGFDIATGIESSGWLVDTLSISGTASTGLYLRSDISNSIFKTVTIDNVGSTAFSTSSGGGGLQSNTFTDFTITRAAGSGVALASSDNNKLFRFFISDVTSRGITLNPGCTGNILHDFRIHNVTIAGLRLENATGNTGNKFSSFLISGSDAEGVIMQNNNPNNTFHNFLVMNNATTGFRIVNSAPQSISHITSVNNATEGIFASIANIDINSIATISNGTNGISSGNNTLHANLIVGGNATQCNGNALVGANCTAGAVDDDSDYTGAGVAGSTAVLQIGELVTNSFNAQAATDSNPHGISVDIAGTITDWSTFTNAFRFWNLAQDGAGGGYPLADQRAKCTAANTGSPGLDCEIFDISLATADSVLKNASGKYLAANDPFTAGSACPQATDASNSENVVSNNFGADAGTNYLVNAVEIVEDTGVNAGDDDGLCETNEACLYLPNMGYYQGTGTYLTAGTCTFTGGNGVTGVQLYAYPTN